MKISAVGLVIGLTIAAGSISYGAGPVHLDVGDPAPDFKLMGSDSEIHSLSRLTGERVVVLAWFPKAFTGG